MSLTISQSTHTQKEEEEAAAAAAAARNHQCIEKFTANSNEDTQLKVDLQLFAAVRYPLRYFPT